MRRILLPLAAAVAIVSGCASSADLNRIHIGMSKAEVISVLGNPDSTSAQANVEYLTYYLENNDGYGRDQPYLVRLVSGTVESFGRAFQLRDLYDRPVTQAQPGSPNFPSLGGVSAVVMAPAGQAQSSPNLATQLQTLAQLHASGALTDEEYAKAKAKLLGQ